MSCGPPEMVMEHGRDSFVAAFDAPRGALAKFDRYAELLAEWQTRMNLVGPSTIPDVWTRHFADSAQLMRLANTGPWLDIGSGAGFPGLVAAILGAEAVHLVESVGKKAKFLETVAAELALSQVTVHNARVEAIPKFTATTISARACAALPQLLDWGLRFADRQTTWLLPKGASVAVELAAARDVFTLHVEQIPSLTSAEGTIVVAHDVRRRR